MLANAFPGSLPRFPGVYPVRLSAWEGWELLCFGQPFRSGLAWPGLPLYFNSLSSPLCLPCLSRPVWSVCQCFLSVCLLVEGGESGADGQRHRATRIGPCHQLETVTSQHQEAAANVEVFPCTTRLDLTSRVAPPRAKVHWSRSTGLGPTGTGRSKTSGTRNIQLSEQVNNLGNSPIPRGAGTCLFSQIPPDLHLHLPYLAWCLSLVFSLLPGCLGVWVPEYLSTVPD